MGELDFTWGMEGLAEGKDTPAVDDLLPGESFMLAATQHPDYFDEDDPRAGKHKALLSTWPAQLPMAIALGLEDLPHILARFDITEDHFRLLEPVPAFRKALAEARRDLAEQGHTFKLKCRGIAEDFLDQLYLELRNESVGLSTKVDIFKYLTKMGGLEPQDAANASGPSAPQVLIQINV